jgi:hypothetical protein
MDDQFRVCPAGLAPIRRCEREQQCSRRSANGRSDCGQQRNQAGVFVAGNSNVVRDKVINEATFGALKLAGSRGNFIAFNIFYNSPIKLWDPAAGRKKASPYR